MNDQCYFCDESEALDRHHVVPRRHGGSDVDKNLVTVCPTCHRKLETLYDSRFYNRLGVDDDTPAKRRPSGKPELDVVRKAREEGRIK